MVLSDSNKEAFEQQESIYLNAAADILTCSRCGAEYVSRGKHDPGYCKECEKQYGNFNDIFIGGPLDGERIGGSS